MDSFNHCWGVCQKHWRVPQRGETWGRRAETAGGWSTGRLSVGKRSCRWNYSTLSSTACWGTERKQEQTGPQEKSRSKSHKFQQWKFRLDSRNFFFTPSRWTKKGPRNGGAELQTLQVFHIPVHNFPRNLICLWGRFYFEKSLQNGPLDFTSRRNYCLLLWFWLCVISAEET